MEDVVRRCPQCMEVWESSGLQDSFQNVIWKANVLNSKVCFGMYGCFGAHANLTFFMKDSSLTLLLLGCEAARNYSFMDGVSKILSIRMLDLLLSNAISQGKIL